jgi:hypothetical protein
MLPDPEKMGTMMSYRRMTAAAAVFLLGGCTIADVTVPPSEDRLVVEAVLRTEARRQFILLHRSVRDQTSVGEAGAEVAVTGPGGRVVVFRETTDHCFIGGSADSEVAVGAACYTAEEGYWVVPGETYDLRVRTTRGEVARARTTVPGAFRVRGIATQDRDDQRTTGCWLPAGTPLSLAWTPAPGAWGYLVPLTIFGLSAAYPPSYQAPDPLELVGVSVSASDTTLVLPGEFGVFDRFDFNQDLLRALQGGLPDRTVATVVVAAADRNYINGVRGGNFNPSGQVRISSIVGDGVGVFGSITPLSFNIRVGITNDASLPPCIGS